MSKSFQICFHKVKSHTYYLGTTYLVDWAKWPPVSSSFIPTLFCFVWPSRSGFDFRQLLFVHRKLTPILLPSPLQRQAVWPDNWIKSCPISPPPYCPKLDKSVLYESCSIWNSPFIYQNIWTTVVRKIVTKKIKKSPNLVKLIARVP